MRDEEDILSCYSWRRGDCFRCAAADVQSAVVDELPTPAGDLHVLRACRSCLLQIEQERADEDERRHRRQCGACALAEEESL